MRRTVSSGAKLAGVTTLSALSVLMGCGLNPGNGTKFVSSASAFSIAPSSLSLVVGQSTQLHVVASASASTQSAGNCQWSSSNTDALTVDASGNVLAISPGVALVKATCSEAAAMASIQIPAAGPAATIQSAYQWQAPEPGSSNSLGALAFVTAQGAKVELLHAAIQSNLGTMKCLSSVWDASGQNLTITYSVGGIIVHVMLSPLVQQGTATIGIAADTPVVSSVDMGAWASNLQPAKIVVPYYTGSIWYLGTVSQYGGAWWDWRATGATALSGTAAQYQPRTDGTLAPMHEQLVVALSPNVDDVFPFPGNTPSPYRSEMAGRMVLDIWTPGFWVIQQGLAELGDYGIEGCAGIIHDWQHAGYDNALPEHYTANESLGGDAGLIAAVAAGKANNCLMAVHENYVDYYPNYPAFDTSAISLTSNGDWLNSWLNGLKIQSYSTKPTWIVKNAANESPVIHEKYGTTAAYLDVSSAASISSHGDMDARESNAGALTSWTQANSALWAYERQTHAGPVLGEGLDHWYYSGLLDGVEAQLGAGIRLSDGEKIPLFVDFDLLRMHPLQVNHGMGYFGRWVQSGSTITTTSQMDAYRTQEIAFGHAPFMDTTYWNDVVHAFVESNLVSPVAVSYGTAQANSIQYQIQNAWVSPSAAARVGQFSTVQVVYDSGVAVVANVAPAYVQWQGLTLPQYGWAAKGDQLLAYTAMCGEVICDYAETVTSVFANARNQTDMRIGMAPAQPSVANIRSNGNHGFSITYGWQVYQNLSSAYEVFVHFVNDSQINIDAGIVFQEDHMPAKPTSQWAAGTAVEDGPWTVQIPSAVRDGTYSIRMGLYDPQTGTRVQLAGDDDGTERYIVGYLTISNGGTAVSFAPPPVTANDPRLNASGAVLNFGTVQTDGMVSIRQEGDQWVLRPFPRNRAFTILLDGTRFPMPPSVQAAGGMTPAITPVPNGQFWQLPLTGAKSYSWPISQN